jgi:hypothetical protein
MLLLLLLADARRPTPAVPQIQMCVISFVAKMKKILVLSFCLPLPFSLSLLLYLMWSPVVEIFFSTWFV